LLRATTSQTAHVTDNNVANGSGEHTTVGAPLRKRPPSCELVVRADRDLQSPLLLADLGLRPLRAGGFKFLLSLPHVELRVEVRTLGQADHPVAIHCAEARVDVRAAVLALSRADQDRAVGQHAHQRRVPGHDPGLTVEGTQHHLRRLAFPDVASRGDHRHVEGRHDYLASFAALRSTSSIPPHMKNACSGMWSYSPSASDLKDAMVSSTGTNDPGWPVKASATNMFWLRNRWIRRARLTRILSSSESSSIPRIAMMSWRSL